MKVGYIDLRAVCAAIELYERRYYAATSYWESKMWARKLRENEEQLKRLINGE